MDLDRLYEYMQMQLKGVSNDFYRYRYKDIEWANQMLGLVGPRGIGKTTLFLQKIKKDFSLENTLYFSADHLFFAEYTLFDTADTFYKHGGKYLFIDEVHKYPQWSRELKMIFDTFPQLHVYFTGSSVLDIQRGEADLSRRAPQYLMQGLSFREYLAIVHNITAPVYTLDQILSHKAVLPSVEHPLPLFKDYLQRGYYPFGKDIDFDIELGQVIERTLEVDIPQYAGMTAATGRKLKRMMAVVSTLVPFKPNLTKLASQIQISRNNVEEYLGFMERAGMLAQLRTGATGIGALGKIEKVYLDNPNIVYNLGSGNEDIGTLRETFFFNQMRVKHQVVSSPISDFCIDDKTFEVGGRHKGQAQIKGADQGFIVKDDIEFGHGNVIPLWAFGLTY